MKILLALFCLLAPIITTSLNSYRDYNLLMKNVNIEIKQLLTLVEESYKSKSFMKCVLICKPLHVDYALFCPTLQRCICSDQNVESVVESSTTSKLQITELESKQKYV